MLMLEELWYSNINQESHVTGDKEYFRELKKLAELGDKLMGILSEEQKKLHEQLQDQQIHVSAIGEKDAFVAGVRFGAEFILDVLCDINMRCA